MKDEATDSKQVVGRRSFMKKSLVTAGTATAAAVLGTAAAVVVALFLSGAVGSRRETIEAPAGSSPKSRAASP